MMESNLVKKIFLMVILSLSLVGAITINEGTTYQTTIGNLTINFTQTAYASSIVVEDVNITLNNFSRTTGTERISFTINETNINYTGLNLPYVSSSSTTQKKITINTKYFINSSVYFDNVDCADIDSGNYTSGNGKYNLTFSKGQLQGSCNSDIIYLQNIPLENSTNNLFEFSYVEAQRSCTAYERISNTIIGIFVALFVVTTSILFYLRGENIVESDMQRLFIGFVGIVVGIAMAIAVFNTMAAGCA